MVQPGVFRCYVPAVQEACLIPLRLLYEGKVICQARDYFEYRDLPFKVGSKRQRDAISIEGSRNQWDQENQPAHKVRLVDRINSFREHSSCFGNQNNENSFMRDYLEAESRFDAETERQQLLAFVISFID